MMYRSLSILTLLALSIGTATAQEVVNVYNSRHYGTDQQLYDAFTEATGIEVNVVEGNHDELIQRLASEGENTPADLLITVDAGRLAFAADQDLLQPVSTPTLTEAVPENLRHPDGLWYGISARARVIVYSQERVDPSSLSTYEALADPEWEGRVLVRSGNNIYNLSLMGALIEALGVEASEQWAAGIVNNFARPPEGGDTDQIRAVAAGQGDVTIVNTYYLGRLLSSDNPDDVAVGEAVGVFFPNQGEGDRGTHVNISGAGVTRHAPNQENAIKLLEYLVTEGQRYFADVNHEYPVNADVEPHPVLKSFGDFQQDTLNAATYAGNSVEAAKIMDRVGWE